MRYQEVIPAVFLERPNRFIALVLVNGQTERVHVKNTGRCRELLIAGCTVYLAAGNQQLPTATSIFDMYPFGLPLTSTSAMNRFGRSRKTAGITSWYRIVTP